MTNKEWLYSLAGEGLEAWFNAEHNTDGDSIEVLRDELAASKYAHAQAEYEAESLREKVMRVSNLVDEIRRVIG